MYAQSIINNIKCVCVCVCVHARARACVYVNTSIISITISYYSHVTWLLNRELIENFICSNFLKIEYLSSNTIYSPSNCINNTCT